MRSKSFSKIPGNETAFSLLEVLIALSIASLLWGSTVFFLVSLQKKLHEVMRSYKIEELQAIHLQFQKDIHSAIKITNLSPDELSIQLAEGEILYKYEDNIIYRKFKDIKTHALDKIQANSWECLSPKDKNSNTCPVILWNFDFNQKNESIYAAKKQIL